MKTLRGQLFFSVSAILVSCALMNTWMSQVWIRKELEASGDTINTYFAAEEKEAKQFASFLLMFRIIEQAADLERVAQMTAQVPYPPPSLWQETANILLFDPNIAFVQAQSSLPGENVVISPKDAVLHSFSFARQEQGLLWIQLPLGKQVYLALPTVEQGQTLYLLFPQEQIAALAMQKGIFQPLFQKAQYATIPETFTSLSIPSPSLQWEESASHLFSSLILHQNEWLEKILLIQALLPWQESKHPYTPAGIVKMPDPLDASMHPGGCMLTQEVFSQAPIILDIASKQTDDIPTIVLRDTPLGKDLDIVRAVQFLPPQRNKIALGFSLSALLQEVSTLIGKTIIAQTDDIERGFRPEGSSFSPAEEELSLSSLTKDNSFLSWQGQEYFVSQIHLQVLSLSVLIPKAEFLAMHSFLGALSERISVKILLSLVAAGLICLILALSFLHRIARKITRPITLLSQASQELSQGKYADITLPPIEQKADEIATLTQSFHGMVQALQDRDKIHGILNKVVSKEISQEILNHTVELAGEEKIVTLLFSDIRNFTHLAEGIPPHTLIEILNAYMTRMCRIIDSTRGVVDKFVGDEIMTLYGAPVALEKHAEKAVEAALAMIQDLSTWNEERKNQNLPVFEIGIGIHTGLVFVGNMGAENRLNYTAIGASVNEASRLCSIAKPMQILISEETYQEISTSQKFHCQKLPPTSLRGIDTPVQIYEVVGTT